jgi:hypothetical protein
MADTTSVARWLILPVAFEAASNFMTEFNDPSRRQNQHNKSFQARLETKIFLKKNFNENNFRNPNPYNFITHFDH